MATRRIVLTGGGGAGKTAVLDEHEKELWDEHLVARKQRARPEGDP